ncbi:hypothetical protein K470DRAFT_14890 [Piedraia hortae CBS 480.64]|uniref:Uncharacterized protein n=1 Tax=Piedraia hortae CBS 480.64 TaxID=1314780 RepID=A0A6A7BPJ8_9PEZI|nr:hypothetical protein K470DRAFT_14890 [Piedraia hortae CBS 480.64]
MHSRHSNPASSDLSLEPAGTSSSLLFSPHFIVYSVSKWDGRLKVKGKSHISRQQASTVQSPQPVQQHNVPVPTSALVLITRNPFEEKGKLLRDAIEKLPAEHRQFVQNQLGSNSNIERDAARVPTLRGQNQTKRSNQWIANMRKIACQIMQFAPVFDVATNAQADVLSLPWAGIRSLLMVSSNAVQLRP